MSLAQRFDHVSPNTVRFWALLDTGVLALALPVTAPWFLAALYWVNGVLGHEATTPAFDAMQWFFVNLAGYMVAVWCAARLLLPLGMLAFVDAVGRTAVGLLIVWYVLAQDAPPVLWFFVFTEGIGAVAQFRACQSRR